MQDGSPATHVSPAQNIPDPHSLCTSQPGQETSHPPFLLLDQGLTTHPTIDAGALVINDDLPTPAATSVNTNKALGSNSVCIPPATQVKDSSHVCSAPSANYGI